MPKFAWMRHNALVDARDNSVTPELPSLPVTEVLDETPLLSNKNIISQHTEEVKIKTF